MTQFKEPLDLGLRFVVEPTAPQLSSAEADLLADLKPAGIMLRKRNFLPNEPYDVWLACYAQLLEDIRAAIGRPSIIVSVDHEGGAVHRYPAPITRFPYAASYGSSREAVTAVARAMAVELVSLGVNLSFSPVADIHSNPANPVINQRSFGRSAAMVAEAACLCAQALRAEGVVPCAKHFPGHGDTSLDSHVALPVLQLSLEDLQQRELVPFMALINDGIEMIMSGHLVAPALDADNPATVSPRIQRDLLRTTLGFRGLTIADALGMQGILDIVRSGSFATRAQSAGLDLFLMAGDVISLDDACRVRDELRSAVESQHLDVQEMQTTQQRISEFLRTLPQHPVKRLESHLFEQHAALSQTLSKNAPFSDFVFSARGFE